MRARIAEFGRYGFIAGMATGALLGVWSERYDWPGWWSAPAGGAVYLVAVFAIHAAARRSYRRAVEEES